MMGAAKRGGVAFAGIPETPAPNKSGAELAADILLYKNPPLTYLAAGAGAVALAAVLFAAHGAHGVTLLTGAGGRASGGGRRCCSSAIYWEPWRRELLRQGTRGIKWRTTCQ